MPLPTKAPDTADPDSADKWEVQLRKGCLELAILAALWSGKLYGLEILRRLESDSALIVSEGTVYPLLSRLKALGLLQSEWVESEGGHPRKYYALTGAGKQRALEMATTWAALLGEHDAIAGATGKGKAMTSDDSRTMEAYLTQLRDALRGVDDVEVREIVEELRSHIQEKAAGGKVETVLATLGNPRDLAGHYLTDSLLERATESQSPVRLLRSLFRWASLSLAGFFVLLGSVVGYFTGGVFILVALCKPFHPQNAGIWTYRDAAGDLGISVRLGYGNSPGVGTDLLGWWIVPVGLLVGGGLVMLTTHCAMWCVRLYRKSRALPGS